MQQFDSLLLDLKITHSLQLFHIYIVYPRNDLNLIQFFIMVYTVLLNNFIQVFLYEKENFLHKYVEMVNI